MNNTSSLPRARFVCGDLSHMKRQCPQLKGMEHPGQWERSAPPTAHNTVLSPNPQSSGQDNSPNPAVAHGSHGLLDNGNVYLVIHVEGQRHLALLDWGCELSLAPSKLVVKRQLAPTSQHIFAANGSPIQVLGETNIEFTVGEMSTHATVLVTPDVHELMLGIRWLTAPWSVGLP